MPGFFTHSYILHEALRTYAPRNEVFKSVCRSHDIACAYGKAGKWKQYDKDIDCVKAGCAYLGASGPDLFYLETIAVKGKAERKLGAFVADLMHYNKTGLFVIWNLRQLKPDMEWFPVVEVSELCNRVAYCIGHISHIAADICVHPYVNSMVAAYPDNPVCFRNAQTMGLEGVMWRFHNVMEHYQDVYVLNKLFYGDRKFAAGFENVNIARAAATWFLDDQHVGSRFLVKKAKEFYGFTKAFEPTVERDKYRFFLSTNALMDLKKYHNDTLPKVATVQACNTLVQGTTGAGRGLLERYLREAVATTHAMWREVEAYLEAPQSSYDDPQLTEDKQHFPLLRRHWNLDCGVAPGVDPGSESWSLPNLAETRLHVAGTLTLNSVHRPDWPDLNAANVPLAAPALGTITVQVVTAGANPVGVCHTLVIESTQSGQEWRFDEVSPDLARSQTYGTQHPFPAGQYHRRASTGSPTTARSSPASCAAPSRVHSTTASGVPMNAAPGRPRRASHGRIHSG